MGRDVKASLTSRKGRIRIAAKTRASKIAGISNLAKARAALASLKSPVSASTSTSNCTTGESTSSTSGQEETPDTEKLTGVPFEEFVDNMHDFRKWGTRTYRDFVHDGAQEYLIGLLTSYDNCKVREKAHQFVVAPDELPLSSSSAETLVKMVCAVSFMLRRITDRNVMALSEEVCKFINYADGTTVRRWTLGFIHQRGVFCNVGYKKREPVGLIRDPAAQQIMTNWMVHASKGENPATAADFASFVKAQWDVDISLRTAPLWLRILGFKFKYTTKQEIYHDGHQRPDVLAALAKYVQDMKDLNEHSYTYTGEDMSIEVKGARLADPRVQRCVVSYHDECSAHANESNVRGWGLRSCGALKAKSRGALKMVAAYVCAEVGIWSDSMRIIEPGSAPGKDAWWTGADTMKQAATHLAEFDAVFPGCCSVDVYDNSSGHNCKAIDGLHTKVRMTSYNNCTTSLLTYPHLRCTGTEHQSGW